MKYSVFKWVRSRSRDILGNKEYNVFVLNFEVRGDITDHRRRPKILTVWGFLELIPPNLRVGCGGSFNCKIEVSALLPWSVKF